MKVMELAVTDRPTERLRRFGANVLTNAELLTVTLNLKDTACAPHLLTQAGGSLRKLAQIQKDKALDVQGIGEGKLDQLRAAFELGRRVAEEQRAIGVPIQSPRDVVQWYAPRLEDLGVEEFHVAILDAQHRLERDVTVTRGILNSSLVHPREVFREAIAERAAAIILVHNHPSGDPTPSTDDRVVTEQLAAAGRVLDIPVHDHVIIGRGRYTSFAEAGLL